MKKLLVLVLALSLIASFSLAGCGGGNVVDPDPEVVDSEPAAVKLGLGVVNSIAKSKDYVAAEGDQQEVLAVGQVDTVMAAATFDKDGKVVSVIIDNGQTRVNFDADLKVTNKSDTLTTKVEKGDQYGMKAASTIGKEWYEQITELENWMVGKTVEEIKAMKVMQRDEAHPSVPDVPELTSLVTLSVEDYIEAVEKAYNNSLDIQDAVNLGLGHVISIGKSKDYAAAEGEQQEVLPMAQVDTIMTATAFDKDGKVVGTLIDNAQIRINFDAEGKVTSDKTAALKTKVENGDGYGMKAASSIDKEWYQQIAELQNWMVGKTVEEIKAMKVMQRDEAHPSVPDVPELTSLVTISVEDYIEAVAEAFENKK
jgi:predicted nucleotidyltransferase